MNTDRKRHSQLPIFGGLRIPLQSRSARARRGSALVIALFALASLAALGAAFLTISTSTARRQASATDNLQAFYIAEAGLSESFQGVRIGRSGQVGTESMPASFGDGLLWVDATETVDGQVRLESTGLYGSGRASLALIVEPVEIPLGFFSDEDLVVESVLMVDGYDSEEGAYQAEAVGEEIKIDPSSPHLHVDSRNSLLFFEGTFYRYHAFDGINTYLYDHSISTSALSNIPEYAGPYDIQWDDFMDDDSGGDDDDGGGGGANADFTDIEYTGVQAYFNDQPVPEEISDDPAIVLGPTTGEGGLLGSNGDIRFQTPTGEPVAIYGDVRPGPEGQVSGAGGDTTIHGSTESRSVEVDLPEVTVPQVALDPALVHSSPIPMLISGGSSGYERIEVATDAELVVRGPATLVVGDLVLNDGASLTFDTRDGDVALYVTNGMDLQPGSAVETTELDPTELTVQVAEIPSGTEAPIQLEATSQFHGTIYAPDTDVYIGGEFEVYGGVVARRLEIGSGARLHFDSADLDGSPIPRVVSWRVVEIPASVKRRRMTPHEVLGVAHGATAPLADAHDLGAVQLSIIYEDHHGTQRTFDGRECDFDWEDVEEIVIADRSPTRRREEPGDVLGPDHDAVDEEPEELQVRDSVTRALTERTGIYQLGSLYGLLPLNQAEVTAMLRQPGMDSLGQACLLHDSPDLTDAQIDHMVSTLSEYPEADVRQFVTGGPMPQSMQDTVLGDPELSQSFKDWVIANYGGSN